MQINMRKKKKKHALLSRREDFAYFADICFKHLGDRVRYWATFNEPNGQSLLAYRCGKFPPSRCSAPFGNCTHGDSEREPFIVAHNMILAHATAVGIYRTKYQKEQRGTIGIVMSGSWFEPISDSAADKQAAERALSFSNNWFLDPIVFGRYPREMVEILGSILPEFSGSEKDKLKNGLDFIGINHYTSYYVQDCIFSTCEPGIGTTKTEGYCRVSSEKNGVPIGPPTEMDGINFYPQGMEKIVTYVKDRYNNTPMFITENGYAQKGDQKLDREIPLEDTNRVECMAGYLEALISAIRKEADVRGYFAWSLLDNFEWQHGYTVRFGLHHVDYATLERTPRTSASWFKQFIAKHKITTLQHTQHVS